MKKTLLTILVAGAACATSSHAATVLAKWTFETNTPADLNDSASGPTVAAEEGTGSFQGIHASAASDWTTPTGNGSANAYSVNTWAVGDYFGFTTSTTGYTDVTVSFAQVSSGTGPRDFELRYSTNGTSFTPFSTYTVLPNQAAAPGVGAWSSSTENTGYNYTFNLSAIDSIENLSTVYFRLVMVSTADATPPGTVATGGTSRVDNVTITAVPEPSTALLGLGSLGFLLRRRRA